MATSMSQACERCWRRKQKCSLEVPMCSQCRIASTQCIPRRFGSTINATSTGSRSGIEALKGRIRALQTRLQYESLEGSPENTTNNALPIVHQPNVGPRVLGGTPPTNSEMTNPRPHAGEATMQDDVAYLSLSAMAERTDHQRSSTESLSFKNLLYAALQISGANPSRSDGPAVTMSNSLVELRQSSLPNAELLSTHEMRAAFQQYVSRIRHTFPYVTSAELNEQYKDATTPYQADGVEQAAPEKLALAYLGTATGLLMSPNYTLKELYAIQLAERASQLLTGFLNHAGRLSVVRCLTALAIFSLFTTRGGSTWHLLGLAITRCISAGMHTARLSDPQSDNIEKRQSSRVFWALYILDTHTSTLLDRPFYLNDRDITVSIPSNLPDADIEDAIFGHLVEHSRILRSIKSSQHPDADMLCHFINIRHWKETIPRQISSDSLPQLALCTQGYVEILKKDYSLHGTDHENILSQIMDEFVAYLDVLEERLNYHLGAVASLEAFQVFAIGIILLTHSQSLTLNHQAMDVANTPSLQGEVKNAARTSQVLNILTLLSARYAAVRSLRDIMQELQQGIAWPMSNDRLRLLVLRSDVFIPQWIQGHLFNFNPTEGRP